MHSFWFAYQFHDVITCLFSFVLSCLFHVSSLTPWSDLTYHITQIQCRSWYHTIPVLTEVLLGSSCATQNFNMNSEFEFIIQFCNLVRNIYSALSKNFLWSMLIAYSNLPIYEGGIVFCFLFPVSSYSKYYIWVQLPHEQLHLKPSTLLSWAGTDIFVHWKAFIVIRFPEQLSQSLRAHLCCNTSRMQTVVYL